MSIFDELGIKPGEAGLMALRTELESRRSKWDRPGYHYRGAGDFLLQHGRFWNGRELPEEFEQYRGEESQCFGNAMDAAQADPNLTYVEGIYCTGAGHYTPHAWCMDPNGEIVEVTLPTREMENYNYMGKPSLKYLPPPSWAYCGVPFPELEFVFNHCQKFGLPMLDRPRADFADREAMARLDLGEDHDYPILKVPFDPTRKEL